MSEIIVGSRVEAGEGEDRDTGVVWSIEGEMARVGWDSGVATRIELSELRETTERWSGGTRLA